MITGELKNKIDSLWEIFWTGGLTNPLDVIEQMTYLMFIHDLDVSDNTHAKESAMLGLPYESVFAKEVKIGERTIDGTQLKWSVFRDYPADRMYSVVQEMVFPFIKNLHADKDSAFSKYMDDAIFKLPTPLMLSKVVDAMDDLYMQMAKLNDSDARGDVYEYLLSKLATAGVNGQFRTPRHIIKMMVELMNPKADDQNTDKDKYSLILANPPFKGSLDADIVSADLLKVCKTKKTELLFLALFVRMLKVGGRCACIVPDGVLFGSSKAHKDIRKEIVENQRLEAVISMPSGVFKPYAGVSTAILIFTKTEHGGTDNVWFYDMQADGFSLDDKRSPIADNDIPDIIERFRNRDAELDRKRTDKSFMVPKQEIVDNAYDLSINKYKEVEYIPVEYPPTSEIMANIREIEIEIGNEMEELARLLGE